jgi:hypothetical protein
MKRYILVLGSLILSACGSPKDALNKVITDKHYIPYEMPMPSTRVGTLLHGNNNEMYLVARPEKCFPDSASQPLRWVQATDIPSQFQHFEFGFDVGISPVFSTGNFSLGFKASASYVKTVQVDIKNPSIEFLDESAFWSYYSHSMTQECQLLLAQYPFIGQGLRVESLSFIFKDAQGAAINLNAKLYEIIDITPGVNWKIERDYTLTITTPKYIGYRMAKLDSSSATHKLSYASTVDRIGNWLFRDVDAAIQTSASVRKMRTQAVRISEPL